MKDCPFSNIDNYIFFTDGINEPKKINVQKFLLNDHTDLTTTSKYHLDATNFFDLNICDG